MSKIIVIINQSNKTKLFEVTIGACLDKNDTFVMSYSILNMLEYMLEYIMKKKWEICFEYSFPMRPY